VGQIGVKEFGVERGTREKREERVGRVAATGGDDWVVFWRTATSRRWNTKRSREEDDGRQEGENRKP
jgi:hypothetical protein